MKNLFIYSYSILFIIEFVSIILCCITRINSFENGISQLIAMLTFIALLFWIMASGIILICYGIYSLI